IEAIEAKVGVDNSSNSSSIDYKLRHLPTQEQNLNIGNYKLTAQQLESNITTGTAPLIVASTTVVSNLNADKVDGKDDTDFFPATSGDLLLSTNTSAPSGWTDISSTYDNKFIRISSGTPLDTGGSNSHTHGAGSYAVNIPSFNSGTGVGGGGAYTGGATDYGPNHYHTVNPPSTSVTGTSASADNIPAYIQIRIFKKD
ncbi:hypothetical protein DRQ26_05570, partial [bacterium]